MFCVSASLVSMQCVIVVLPGHTHLFLIWFIIFSTLVLKQEFMKRVADIVADKGLDMAAWEDGLYANDRPVPVTDFKER